VALRFRCLGKWGGSPDGDSPTLWVDEETGDFVVDDGGRRRSGTGADYRRDEVSRPLDPLHSPAHPLHLTAPGAQSQWQTCHGPAPGTISAPRGQAP
jgi:hypothetical protein